jgi:hypothetical protein
MTLSEQFGDFDFVNGADRGAQNLHEWVKYSPNIKALVNSVMPEIQELNDAQKDVYTTINIFDAVGTQLDNIFGNLLDLARTTGQTDDDYRLDLLARSSVLSRSGEITSMKSVYQNLITANLISLYEYQPAAFKMEATVSTIPSDATLAKIRSTLVNAKQGGNTMILSVTDAVMIQMEAFTSIQTDSPTGLSGPSHVGGTLTKGF